MISLSNAVNRLNKGMVITQSYVYQDGKCKNWAITKPIKVVLSSGQEVVIPKGYTYDMATVPKWLWSFVRPYNQALLAYLIHDYLYTHKDFQLSRLEVDREWLLWANVINPRGKKDNYFRYLFIRLFGGLWWDDWI